LKVSKSIYPSSHKPAIVFSFNLKSQQHFFYSKVTETEKVNEQIATERPIIFCWIYFTYILEIMAKFLNNMSEENFQELLYLTKSDALEHYFNKQLSSGLKASMAKLIRRLLKSNFLFSPVNKENALTALESYGITHDSEEENVRWRLGLNLAHTMIFVFSFLTLIFHKVFQ
jgi:hypothetical protein